MHPVLNQNLFLVKEHVGYFKAANNFDIYDPETNQMIMECREDNLSFFVKLMRFSNDYKRMTPFDIEIRTPDGEPVCSVKRGWTFFRSEVSVFDEDNERIGGFRQHILSIGGAFTVIDSEGKDICTLKGKWTGWDFRFVTPSGTEFAHVTKKWAGFGKELFTSADNYILEINEAVPPDNSIRQLILAAVMCIDMVLKE